jgi:murein DD-endopeptidase MepM/ murein hydrolase activator NlpD
MQEPLAGRPLGRSTPRGRGETGTAPPVGQTIRRIRLWLSARWADDLLMNRTAAHLAVLFLVALVIILTTTLPLPRSPAAPWQTLRRPVAQREASTLLNPQQEDVTTLESDSLTTAEHPSSLLPASSVNNGGQVLVRAAVPHTIIPERSRVEISHYVVQSGDTIFGIAAQFGLAPETIMWANGRFVEDNPDLLRVGQELVILPVNGVYHQVGGDDTLETIAAAYKVEPSAIINYSLNELEPDAPQIVSGQWLVVPGGTKPYVPRTVVAYSGPIPDDASKGTGIFGWPTAGQITQGYWDRHRALDIGAWTGAPVVAADSGYVVAAGWDDSGYGRMVVIDHGNGFQTLYAHLQVYYVEVGDSVAKGEKIAEVGSTGNSSGPHLHFEMHQSGVQRNPFGFLP